MMIVPTPRNGSTISQRSAFMLGSTRKLGKRPQKRPPMWDMWEVSFSVKMLRPKKIMNTEMITMRMRGRSMVSKLSMISAMKRPKMPKHVPEAPTTIVHPDSHSAETRLPPAPEMNQRQNTGAVPYFASRWLARATKRHMLAKMWLKSRCTNMDVNQRQYSPSLIAGVYRPPHMYKYGNMKCHFESVLGSVSQSRSSVGPVPK
mmetsp:Transcript_63826/g.201931  ORF Transcript_63826/g.201931 Transcript_63826/m.201931 type:complete len:203 (+) Transcript_63826:419-1027(+)